MKSIKKKSHKILLGSVFLAALLISALKIYDWIRPLAVVGQWEISKEDVKFRDQIILLSFPEEKRSMGLYQLIKSAINYEILKNNGVALGDLQVKEEAKRINDNTKNPEQLNLVKKIFAGNQEAYEKNFILPNLVDHMIYYDFFLKDEKIQAASLQATTDFISKARLSGANFQKLAEQMHLPLRKLTISLKDGLTWENPGRQQVPGMMQGKSGVNDRHRGIKVKMADNENQEVLDRVNAHLHLGEGNKNIEDAKKWYDTVIEPLKPGEVAATPLSQDENWLVAHYVGKNRKGAFELEIVAFHKLSFNDWYEKEKAKVQITVNDKSRPVP